MADEITIEMIKEKLALIEETLESVLDQGIGKKSPIFHIAKELYPDKTQHNGSINIKRKIQKFLNQNKSNLFYAYYVSKAY